MDLRFRDFKVKMFGQLALFVNNKINLLILSVRGRLTICTFRLTKYSRIIPLSTGHRSNMDDVDQQKQSAYTQQIAKKAGQS